MDHEEKVKTIEECKDWLARERARIDQKEKQFHDQYALAHPFVNLRRLEDLEIWKFRLEINEWELENFMVEGES